MERGSPFHLEKFYNEQNSPSYSGDMTQDSGPSEEENKERIQLLELECGTIDECSLELKSFESDEQDVIKSERESTKFLENTNNCNAEKKLEEKSAVQLTDYTCSETVRSKSDSVKCNRFNNSDFTISNSVNSMKSIRMNIRRKRFCSNSSAVSNNDSVGEEKRSCRRVKKRRRRKSCNGYVYSNYKKNNCF